MSLLHQFKLLSEYNLLMNQRLYEAVGELSDDKIKEDTGAFFGSILGTLNHILVGDIIWLNRFGSLSSSKDALAYVINLDKPKTLDSMLFLNFSALRKERDKIDRLIILWVNLLSESELNATINYQNMAGESFNKNCGSLINHLFLHQVHHRGQVTTLLSQLGIDFGETDFIEIIK